MVGIESCLKGSSFCEAVAFDMPYAIEDSSPKFNSTRVPEPFRQRMIMCLFT